MIANKTVFNIRQMSNSKSNCKSFLNYEGTDYGDYTEIMNDTESDFSRIAITPKKNNHNESNIRNKSRRSRKQRKVDMLTSAEKSYTPNCNKKYLVG